MLVVILRDLGVDDGLILPGYDGLVIPTGEAALTHGGSPCLPVRRKSTIIFGSLFGAEPTYALL